MNFFYNKRANLGETVHFPTLRKKAVNDSQSGFRGTSYVFREKSWNK